MSTPQWIRAPKPIYDRNEADGILKYGHSLVALAVLEASSKVCRDFTMRHSLQTARLDYCWDF